MADQFIGQVLADKYRIDSLISEDNLGNYYHATHLLMEKPVAVKILSPTLAVDETIVKRFATEARTVSRISHPNILNVTDYGSDKSGTVFIVYEDATGETLKDVIKRVGKFPLERANHIVKQIASALSVAHANGIVHKDLMSDNILVRRTPTDPEEVKIFNFYIESKDEADNHAPDITERAKYVSPEMINTPAEVDERADVYSLGVILYEMLAGEVPFTAEKPTEVLLKHVQEMPPPIATFRFDLPDEIGEVLMTALAKKPDLRYQTVNNLADSLNRITLFYGDKNSATKAKAAVAETTPNNIWKTAFIVLVGVCLMSGFFIYMTNAGKQTNPSTQLQSDANGQPVQPLNPSTGSGEQTYSNMNSFDPNNMYGSNSNTAIVDPSGGYGNPWGEGRNPVGPPTQGNYGTPYPVYPTNSQTVSIDPCQSNSQFMPPDCVQTVIVPKNTNVTVNTQVNAKGKNSANTNIQPQANTNANPTTKTSPTPVTTTTPPPIVKPLTTPTPKTKVTASPQPKTTQPPAATDKRPPSGKEQDS